MQAKVNDRWGVFMQSSERGRKDSETFPCDQKIWKSYSRIQLKKNKLRTVYKKISLYKLFSHCRQRTGRKCGMYSDQRKHSLREISHMNLQHTYLPCLPLNRMGSWTHTLFPSEKSYFLEIFSPKPWEQRAVPRGRTRRSPGSWTEGLAALLMLTGAGAWKKTIALTSK